MNAGPKPSPAIAVPTNRAAAVPVSIEANVTKAPTIRTRQPPSITVDGFFLASKAEAAAPRPLSRNIKIPPQSKFFECSSRAALQRTGRKLKPNSVGKEEQATGGRTRGQARQHHQPTARVVRHRAEQ